MSFLEILKIELKKVKRSKILPILFIPPLLVIISGIASLERYMTPEYPQPWKAMFVQSALLFGYYLLPLSMVVVSVMTANKEKQNNGILKMLALPIKKEKLALAKFFVLVIFLIIELAIFFGVFIAAGFTEVMLGNITEQLPVLYLFAWMVKLFLASLPSLAVIWAVTVFFGKPIITIGLNILFIIPGVLAANTPLWKFYPYCYSGYMITGELYNLTAGASESVSAMPWLSFLVISLLFIGAGILISVKFFGRKETK